MIKPMFAGGRKRKPIISATKFLGAVYIVFSIFILSCNKGKNSVQEASLGYNFTAAAQEVPGSFSPNTLLEFPFKFIVTSKEGRPISRVKTEFKAFVISEAITAGLSDERIARAIFANWDSVYFNINETGELTQKGCSASSIRDVCAGQISGGTAETNMDGISTVGFKTANNLSAVIAVAMKVPSDSLAGNLVQFAKIRIQSLEEFASNVDKSIDATLTVIPPLFDSSGRLVVKAGVPFNLSLFAFGIPSTEAGKGISFDFQTENLNDVADGVLVNVPANTGKCDFYNDQCIIPGGPFRVLKPTILKITVKPTDPTFPVKPATIELPVVTGEAKKLVLSSTPPSIGITNPCLFMFDMSQPCIELSADVDSIDFWPAIVDEGGNLVSTSQTTWSISGPLQGKVTSSTVPGKQTLMPEVTGSGIITVKADQFPGMEASLSYLVRSGKPASLSAKSEHSSLSFSEERATVPFKTKMTLYDRKDNLCVDFSGPVGVRLKLQGTYPAQPPQGISSTSQLVDTLDHMTTPVYFTAGKAISTSAFNLVKVPVGDESRPNIVIDESTIPGLLIKESLLIDILPGPATQGIFRNATGGLGDSWNSQAVANAPVNGITPPNHFEISSDQQYFFYVGGYDAGGNYTGDLHSKFWGVNYKLDSLDPVASGLSSTILGLVNQVPAAYKELSMCPIPSTIPDVVSLVAQSSDQPLNLFCGLHRGLMLYSGSNTVFQSQGITGSGRILAVPTDKNINAVLSPVLTITSGTATKYTFEFIEASTNVPVIPPIRAGMPFKIRIHAKDTNNNDALMYNGIRNFETVSTSVKSWLGVEPHLPSGQVNCTFNQGVCTFPDTYFLTNSRSAASITIEQTESMGVKGPWSTLITTIKGSEAYLVFTSKKGGPLSGATVKSPEADPVGIELSTDGDVPFGIAFTDLAGNYIRDASMIGDGLTFDGFISNGGSLEGIFDSNAWQSSPWLKSFATADLFVANPAPTDGLSATPKKFYDPSNSVDVTSIASSNRNSDLYTTVLVPQNRVGKGFAVVRSSIYPTIKSWPSPWFKIRPGVIEHAEYVLSNSTNTAVNNSNVLSGSCNDVRVLLHDRKHNQLVDYNAVVNFAVKFFRTDSSHPNGFDDPHAGDMSFIQSMRTCDNTAGCTSPKSDFYRTTNRPELGNPASSGMYVPEYLSQMGGGVIRYWNNNSPFAITTDWFSGNASVLSGEMQIPGSVCLNSGATLANYSSANASDKTVMQVDLAPTTIDGITTPGLTTRGAGVQFIGSNGATVGSAATSHNQPDIFTVKRGPIHHLHGTMVDATTWWGGEIPLTGLEMPIMYVGVSVDDDCILESDVSFCGPRNVYWHTHDAAHNFIKPGSTNGFNLNAVNAPPGQIAVGEPGALGSASIRILANNLNRLAFSLGWWSPLTQSWGDSVTVSNSEAMSYFRVNVAAGRAAQLLAERLGDFTLNTDNPFGFRLKLKDQYGNLTAKSPTGRDYATLKFYWQATPDSAPDGTSVPILVGSSGIHNSIGTALAKSFVRWPAAELGMSFRAEDPQEQSLLVAANKQSTLKIQYINDNQTLTTQVSLLPIGGRPEKLVFKSQPDAGGVLYNSSNYATLFNTAQNYGFGYPFVPNAVRLITAYACAEDKRKNLDNCSAATDFSFEGSNPETALSTNESLAGVGKVTFFPNKTGNGVIRASRLVDGALVTGVTDPLIIGGSIPFYLRFTDDIGELNPAIQTVQAGTEIKSEICMIDGAENVMTGVSESLSVNLSYTGFSQTSEGKSLRISSGTGASFDSQEIYFGANTLSFSNGCVNLYAKILAAGAYNNAPLIKAIYVFEPSQSNRRIEGEGLTVEAVTPLTPDHYVTELSYDKMSSFPMNFSTEAWADPSSENVLAANGGNRFPVTIRVRDIYGNDVNAPSSTTVNLSLVEFNGNSVGSSLVCSAPQNSTDCLSLDISNRSFLTVENLALQVGGRQFFINAHDGQIGTKYSASNPLYSNASGKTVFSYGLSFDSTAVAGNAQNITVTALDISGNKIVGADNYLNALNFTFFDGSGNTVASHVSPNGSVPILPGQNLNFSSGISINPIILTKAESGLVLKLKDDQSPPKMTSSSSTTTVYAGTVLKYGITCTKTVSGENCSGSSASPFSLKASVTDKINLAVQAYDQYQNPRAGEFSVPLKVNYVSGTATLIGAIDQSSAATGFISNARNNANQILLDASSANGALASNLFYRVGNQTLTVTIEQTASSHSGMVSQPYFVMQPSIDMVSYFGFSGLNSNITAGASATFTVKAVDAAANVATGIDQELSNQTYTWSGPTNAPNGSTPILPSGALSFTNGVTGQMSITLRAKEAFYLQVKDNYTPAVENMNWYCNVGGNRCGNRYVSVSPALAVNYKLTTTTTEPFAGSPFDVTVSALDQFANAIPSWVSDQLTFQWISGASSSVTNPKTSEVLQPKLLAAGTQTFDGGTFTTTLQPFVLYRTNTATISPTETSILKVTGQSTTGTQSSGALTGQLSFNPQPAQKAGYLKITTSGSYSQATEISGQSFDMTADQTKNLFAHIFDAFGNYKGNIFSIAWSGSSALAGKFDVGSGSVAVLSPTAPGTGSVSGVCTGLDSGCVGDSSGTISVTAGNLNKLVFISPSPSTSSFTQTTEACQELKIQAQDAKNNPVTMVASLAIQFNSAGGNGDFFASSAECTNAQNGGNGLTALTGTSSGQFHYSGLSGSQGIRSASIPVGQNGVSVWYANRTTVSGNGVTITASNANWSATKQASIISGSSKRLSYNSPTFSTTATNCLPISYTFLDKWNNVVELTSSSTLYHTSTGGATAAFYSDNSCANLITNGQRTVTSGSGDTIYYKNAQANTDTVKILATSTLMGNVILQEQIATITVNPGNFSITSPTSGVSVKDTVTINWSASIGARDYSVTYGGTSSNCSGGVTLPATTLLSATIPSGRNVDTYVCVAANGYAGSSPGTPKMNATNNSAFWLRIDNTVPTGTISAPATTYIGPLTSSMGSGNTTVFSGTAADNLSGVALVQIQLQQGSNYWNGAAWNPAASWVNATISGGSWSYTMDDSVFNAVGDNSSYTLKVRVSDGSTNLNSAAATKTFNWMNSPASVTSVSANTIDGSYKQGGVINIVVNFNKLQIVVGNPQITLETGATDAVVNYSSGSNSTQLVFAYTIAAGHTSPDLDYISASALALAGSTIKDLAENPASLSLPNPGGAGSLGSSKNIIVDTTAPTATSVTSSTSDGLKKIGDVIDIEVNFSEIVDVTGTPTLALNSGGVASYFSGSGTNILTFRYTVVEGNSSADLDYLSTSALALAGGTIKDRALNNASLTLPIPSQASSLGAQKALIIDGVKATVSSVSSTTAAGSYSSGTGLQFNVQFSEIVTVTGTPYLSLNSTGQATYLSGSGTQSLVFQYTVASGHNSSLLDYSSTSAFALNSGTIVDAAGNSSNLTLVSPGAVGSVSSNNNTIVIDTSAPSVSSVSSSTANGSYKAGQVIAVTVTFSEVVNVSSGTPTITLETGATDAVVNYSSGSGSAVLTFNYTVAAGDTSADLDYSSTTALALNGATIRDAAGNNATLTLASPSLTNSLGNVKAIVVDTTSPTLAFTSVSPMSPGNSLRPTIKGTASETSTITLYSDSSCTAAISTGSSNTNFAATGITLSSDLTANASNIIYGKTVDTAQNASNCTSLTTYQHDGSAPTVTSVTSSTADGLKKIGDVIDIQVNFSETVDVTGTPTLALNSGGTAVYFSGNGTNILTFRYTVVEGNSSADLDYLSTSALALAGGTIKDRALNNASLTLPIPSQASSLGAQKALIIDGVKATVSSVSSTTAAGSYSSGTGLQFNVQFSEIVTVTGTPYLSLNSTGQATYLSGSGTQSLVFQYTVASGHNSSLLDYSSTSAFALNSGTIVDAAGNSSNLTLVSPGAVGSVSSNNNTIVIDTSAPSVSSVSSSTANGSYKAGQVIAVTVTFSEVVNVSSGTPTITLETGATDAVVNYSSGSGSAVLTFNYTVAAGDTSADLDYSSTTALALNGATIRDAAGNNATLTLASPNLTNSLGNAKAIVVDTTSPTLAFSSGLPSTYSKSPTLNVGVSSGDAVSYSYAVIAGSSAGCGTATLTSSSVGTNITNSLSGFTDGQLTICAKGTDLAGNTQTAFTSYSWNKDTAAPSLFTFTTPAAQTSSTYPTIAWTTPAIDVNGIELKLAKTSGCGSNVIESYLYSGGTFSALPGNASSQTVSLQLNDGKYYLCATVWDAALNQSSVITGSFEVETDTVHVSWSADNAIFYGNKAQTSAWITETVNSSVGTYNSRTSLALDGSSNAYVSYGVVESTSTHMRYRKRTATNTWDNPLTVYSYNNSGIGSFNELAVDGFSTVVSSFFGMDPTTSGLFLGQNTTAGPAPGTSITDSANIKDISLAVGTSNSRYGIVSELSGSNYILRLVNHNTSVSSSVTLPTSCVSAPYVSAVAKGSDTTIGLAVACVMSDTSCKVHYGEASYSSSAFSYSSWSTVGSIQSTGCTNSSLSVNERPALAYDFQNSNKVSIVWYDKQNINRWSNESGTSSNETVLATSATPAGSPTIALDKLGKSYVIYRDGNALKFTTNNSRADATYTGAWSSPVTIITPSNLQGVGSIGISGMKGRGNVTGAQ